MKLTGVGALALLLAGSVSAKEKKCLDEQSSLTGCQKKQQNVIAHEFHVQGHKVGSDNAYCATKICDHFTESDVGSKAHKEDEWNLFYESCRVVPKKEIDNCYNHPVGASTVPRLEYDQYTLDAFIDKHGLRQHLPKNSERYKMMAPCEHKQKACQSMLQLYRNTEEHKDDNLNYFYYSDGINPFKRYCVCAFVTTLGRRHWYDFLPDFFAKTRVNVGGGPIYCGSIQCDKYDDMNLIHSTTPSTSTKVPTKIAESVDTATQFPPTGTSAATATGTSSETPVNMSSERADSKASEKTATVTTVTTASAASETTATAASETTVSSATPVSTTNGTTVTSETIAEATTAEATTAEATMSEATTAEATTAEATTAEATMSETSTSTTETTLTTETTETTISSATDSSFDEGGSDDQASTRPQPGSLSTRSASWTVNTVRTLTDSDYVDEGEDSDGGGSGWKVGVGAAGGVCVVAAIAAGAYAFYPEGTPNEGFIEAQPETVVETEVQGFNNYAAEENVEQLIDIDVNHFA